MAPPRVNPFHDDVLPPFAGFPKDAFSFFSELRANNTREWFEANKKRYLSVAREPMLMLLGDLRRRLPGIAADLDLDPARAVYRIYRDVRFSKNKTPYKTNIAASFGFAGAHKEKDPGFYIELSDKGVNFGAGLYMPSGDQLRAIRARIDRDENTLRALLREPTFVRCFTELQGVRLRRIPSGYPADHPAADLLRLKQYLLWAPWPAKSALTEDLVDRVESHVRAALPLVRWLRG